MKSDGWQVKSFEGPKFSMVLTMAIMVSKKQGSMWLALDDDSESDVREGSPHNFT